MKIALIADDEPLIRRQVAETIECFGFDRIIEAADGSQAVSLACSETPLLIIMDVSMPGMDGVTAAEKISNSVAAPIILLTGTSDSDTIARARDAGVLGYQLKPFQPAQLQATVELAIHQFVELNNLRDENARLKDTLATRKLVDQAKGILIANGLSEPEAHRKMQKLAMDKRKSLKQVAEAILLTAD
ncbi:ANTAR domain-containing response regulator [Geothermobacter hydrogeniphilus]|uniref:Response regulator n=1 Tax=Geothermobacter hydrogeniphilus TaxID=1969733 RepID=A0A1X0Y0M9_9BACT|nr:response regulator [Geothermobacter hydrogeniphilus]ORJ58740.1 response regulator [Geothermobacter hydrogeniphilus]